MPTTTPSFGWPVPVSSDLVKDGATAIESLGDAIDGSMADLKGGTTGQVLAKATNTDMDFSWTTPATATSKVVQVVNAQTSTQVLSSSSTFADTNLTATITPTSASNKILVFVNQNGVAKYATNTRVQIRLVRGATTILNLDSNAANNDSGAGNSVGSVSCVYLDSPATTSATTYKTQFNSSANSGTAYLQDSTSPGTTSTILLMEVTP
jgi:hypothetical protein